MDVLFQIMLKLHTHTVIAKDNIYLNAQSTIIKSHIHGISMSVLQLPTLLNPWVLQQCNLKKKVICVLQQVKKFWVYRRIIWNFEICLLMINHPFLLQYANLIYLVRKLRSIIQQNWRRRQKTVALGKNTILISKGRRLKHRVLLPISPGEELPYIDVRGRAEIWGIHFIHYNPDFWVIFGRYAGFLGMEPFVVW